MKFDLQTAIILAVLTGLLSPIPADADPIVIDPGPVGPVLPYAQIASPFNALNGTALSGQTLSLDFIFADEKWIQTARTSPSGNHVLMDLWTNYTGVELRNAALPGAGYFLDINGDPLPGSPIELEALALVSGGPGGWWAAILYDRDLSSKPYRYYGIHLDCTLPVMPGVSVTSAGLRQGGIDYINVPDPGSTLLLFGFGLVGVRACRKRWP